MRPDILIEKFNYELPEDKIAKYPLSERDSSKLLILNKDSNITSDSFINISNRLPKESLVLFNNTKVIRARLLFRKHTGAKIEVFCLEPANNLDVQIAFSQRDESNWLCIIGNSKKWKNGSIESSFIYNNKTVTVKAERVEKFSDSHHIKFTWSDNKLTFGEIIEHIGVTPIPPYLNRETEDIDLERYQTVYSKHEGSVAAPTAGLHFTPKVMNELALKNITTDYITLHVGAGTFKPVQTNTITDHEMHVEHFSVSKKTIEQLLLHKGPVIAVGTTTTRTLESLYWLGLKILNNENDFMIHQWEPYEKKPNLSFSQSLNNIITFLTQKKQNELSASTGIMIAPGYCFMAIDALITNFHQPQSTLLLLLGALIDDKWKEVYNYALKNNFRFLSYGDSSLIFNPNERNR
ncbi:MAG: S-adenosylmethionine:tRNA ribosyltransferase-isomerase [Bacteroidales bacterium]|nr:S-adenosylmethionine:tRNA ribosyltransferase-isomerase [Bacteroidales bacterium]